MNEDGRKDFFLLWDGLNSITCQSKPLLMRQWVSFCKLTLWFKQKLNRWNVRFWACSLSSDPVIHTTYICFLVWLQGRICWTKWFLHMWYELSQPVKACALWNEFTTNWTIQVIARQIKKLNSTKSPRFSKTTVPENKSCLIVPGLFLSYSVGLCAHPM